MPPLSPGRIPAYLWPPVSGFGEGPATSPESACGLPGRGGGGVGRGPGLGPAPPRRDVALLEARRISQSAGARAPGPVGWLRAVGRLRRRSACWALQ